MLDDFLPEAIFDFQQRPQNADNEVIHVQSLQPGALGNRREVRPHPQWTRELPLREGKSDEAVRESEGLLVETFVTVLVHGLVIFHFAMRAFQHDPHDIGAEVLLLAPILLGHRLVPNRTGDIDLLSLGDQAMLIEASSADAS